MAGGREFALYAASRSVAFPLAVIYAMALRSNAGVATLALTTTLVRLFDGFIGFVGELEQFPRLELHRVANTDELLHCWFCKTAFNLRDICTLAGHSLGYLFCVMRLNARTLQTAIPIGRSVILFFLHAVVIAGWNVMPPLAMSHCTNVPPPSE
jgi:hypothetical protein